MSELYWITRLDAICIFIGIAIAVSLALMVMAFFIWMDGLDDDDDRKERGRKIFIRSLIAITILAILEIFTPSERQMYKIYGLGGMKEFIESSEEAKKLPDKTIKALDLFLDRIIEEEK